MSVLTGDSLSYAPISNKIWLLIFVLSLALYPILAQQTSEPNATSSRMSNSIPPPDFTITATLPSTVPADGTTQATSTVVVNALYDFADTVTLSDLLPADITCTAIHPSMIPKGLGTATLSCRSMVPGTFAVTITGVSGGIRHNTTRTFTFSSFNFPDFTITAMSLVTLTSGTEATLDIIVTPQGGFDTQVNLTTYVNPSVGLSVSLTPQDLVLGSGLSEATFGSSNPGDYTVTIEGSTKSLSHSVTIVVAVILTGVPDFVISADSGSINIGTGSSGRTRITITPSNGFANTVSLVAIAPAGVFCSLNPSTLQSSGESTLTCNRNIPGDFTVTITATGGTSKHAATVIVHVAAVSPSAPNPQTVLGLAPAVSYGFMAGLIAVVVAGVLLIMKSRRSNFGFYSWTRTLSSFGHAKTFRDPSGIQSGV